MLSGKKQIGKKLGEARKVWSMNNPIVIPQKSCRLLYLTSNDMTRHTDE